MKVLSLFDGMACGMIAMQLACVEVESYDAYEIDKYAIKTAQHNFPMIKEHGDVFGADFTQYDGVDFLIGGSPCTYWSIAQTKNRETVASGMGWELFSQYVRALHEAKPKYFIYENNKSMSKAIRESSTETFGFEPICINSALVSAQSRQRLYWVGKRNDDGTYSKVPVEQPEDRGILLKDVLDNAVAMRDKAHTIDANYYKGGNFKSPNKQSGKRLMAAEPINTDANEKAFCVTYRYYKGFGNNPGKCLEKHRDSMVAEAINVTEDGKSQTLKAQYCKNSVANFCCYSSTYGASGVAEPVNITQDGKARTLIAGYHKQGIENCCGFVGFGSSGVAEPINCTAVGKEITIYDVKDGKITINGKQYPIKLKDGYYIIRKLTVRECMRLQTVPEWYEFPVSDSQAYKMLGNGWTCEVIAHILKSLKEA